MNNRLHKRKESSVYTQWIPCGVSGSIGRDNFQKHQTRSIINHEHLPRQHMGRISKLRETRESKEETQKDVQMNTNSTIEKPSVWKIGTNWNSFQSIISVDGSWKKVRGQGRATIAIAWINKFDNNLYNSKRIFLFKRKLMQFSEQQKKMRDIPTSYTN